MCSSASCESAGLACTHRPGGSPTQFASAVSNICTYTSPTSRRTHSSNTSIRNRPYCSGADRAAGDEVAVLYVERAVAPRATSGTLPSSVGLGDALDDGDELDEARAALVAQEAIHLASAVLVRGVDRREDVALDAACRAGAPSRASPGRTLPRPPLVRRKVSWISRGPSIEIPTRKSCSLKNAAHSVVELVPLVWIVYSGSLPRLQVLRRPARRSGGRTRAPSTSARHPAMRPARPGRGRAPRSAGGCRSPAAPRPSGSDCPDTASPWRERSSRSSRGCRWRRWASRAGEKPPAHRHASRPSSDVPAPAGHRSAITAACTSWRDRLTEQTRHGATRVALCDLSGSRAGPRGGLLGRRAGPRGGHFAGRSLFPRRPRYRRPRRFARRVVRRAHPVCQHDLYPASQTPSFVCSSASSEAAKAWIGIRPPATN